MRIARGHLISCSPYDRERPSQVALNRSPCGQERRSLKSEKARILSDLPRLWLLQTTDQDLENEALAMKYRPLLVLFLEIMDGSRGEDHHCRGHGE